MGRTLLITGATGSVSSVLRATLQGSDFEIRAMIRDQAKAAPLRHQGVQVVVGDLDDPRSLPPVFKGVLDLWLLIPKGPRAPANPRRGPRLRAVGANQRTPTVSELEQTNDNQITIEGTRQP